MKYRAEIDGLRALAVVPVILFHAGVKTLSGGFAGVDVFFVISGYLISTILLDELRADRFSLVGFYERRARRILPALLTVLLTITAASWFVMLPHTFLKITQQLVSNALFMSNVHYALTWGYFEAWRLPPIFLNTWSLAVEEQFYLLFPLLLLLTKRRSPLLLLALLVGLFVGSVAWAEVASIHFAKLGFYLLPSRAWELLAGAIVALLAHARLARGEVSSPVAGVLSTVGLAMITLSFFIFEKPLRYPSLITLLPVLGTALFIHFARPGQVGAKLLSYGPVVYVGKISYSLYLWHFPLLVLLEYGLAPKVSGAMIGTIGVSLTLALSSLTYHWVEQPFRRKTLLPSRGAMLATSLAALVACALVGFAGHKQLLRPYPALTTAALDQLVAEPRLPRGQKISDCAATNASTRCELLGPDDGTQAKRRVLIVGDSFAADLVAPFAKLLRGQPQVSLVARITYACSFTERTFENWDGECGRARALVDALTRADATDVIFTANFVAPLNRNDEATGQAELASLGRMFRGLLAKEINVHLISHRNVYDVEPARAYVLPHLTAQAQATPA
ncbi:MAG: acyltransferase family protein, partial [Pseudomonadota bacterium]